MEDMTHQCFRRTTRARQLLAAVPLMVLLTIVAHASESRLPQRVIYVGHRTVEFEPLLKSHFVKVQSTTRERFQPQSTKDFDVVLLDWPQGGAARQERLGASPLGKREEWSKPTVLLGSAGLNLAIAWKAKGGSG